jgi:hypothetical protein
MKMWNSRKSQPYRKVLEAMKKSRAKKAKQVASGFFAGLDYRSLELRTMVAAAAGVGAYGAPTGRKKCWEDTGEVLRVGDRVEDAIGRRGYGTLVPSKHEGALTSKGKKPQLVGYELRSYYVEVLWDDFDGPLREDDGPQTVRRVTIRKLSELQLLAEALNE